MPADTRQAVKGNGLTPHMKLVYAIPDNPESESGFKNFFCIGSIDSPS